jgi:hypothetical protein
MNSMTNAQRAHREKLRVLLGKENYANYGARGALNLKWEYPSEYQIESARKYAQHNGLTVVVRTAHSCYGGPGNNGIDVQKLRVTIPQ